MNNAMMYQNSRRKENCDTWRVGIYCRLSKDDELNGESASISNQRDILTNYCNSQGWQIVGVFQDDGYTGLNTERPDLQRLLQACEKGLVNLVITKDQSRLGRNHVQTGYLMEEFFPKHGVRYVALYDNVDTYAGDNEIAPFKNVLNEMYSRDISKKVHASYHLQATKGKFTGVVPPLGYLKDPDEKGHLLIDEETAPIVRKIFQWAVDGRGINYISRELERQKVPCPSWWHRKRGNRTYYTKWEQKDPENGKYVWDESYLKDLLRNPVYCGDMASQKRYYRFKIGSQGDKAPDEWITVEDTHEPIISRDTFELVQAKIRSRKRQNTTGEYSIFAGLLRCAECGGALTIRKTNSKEPREIYSCSTYIHKGKAHCSQHRVDADDLYDAVLSKIRECARIAVGGCENMEERVRELCQEDEQDHRDSIEKLAAKQKDRLESLDRLIARLYDDLISEKISEATFDKMLEKTQKEQSEIKQELVKNQKLLDAEEKLDAQSQQWAEDIGSYTDITELDANILNRLISKIVISEPQDDESNNSHAVEMEIHFNLSPIPELGTIERGSSSIRYF